MITREHDQYVLRSIKTGAVLGRHPSRAAAKRQELAVKAAQHADGSDLTRAQRQLARAEMNARSRARRKPKRVKPAALPNGIVVEYTRRLLALSRSMDDAIAQVLTGHGILPHAVDLEAEPHVIVPVTPGPVPTNDAATWYRSALARPVRLDAPADGSHPEPPPGLAAALRDMQRKLAALTGNRQLLAGVNEIATRTADHSLTQWRAQVQQSLGISVANNVQVAPLVDGFRQRNLDLIVSLAADKVQRVRDVFDENPGARVETLARRIQDESGATASRAALIARDQVLKFNAQVTQAQHEAAGITQYEWSTSQDERVRESHAALDGQIIDYDNPPVVDEKTGRTAHAGEDYQCRCTQIPVIPEFDESAAPAANAADESADEEPPPETPEPVPARAEPDERTAHPRHAEIAAAAEQAHAANRAQTLARIQSERDRANAAKEEAHAVEIARLRARIAETKARIAASTEQLTQTQTATRAKVAETAAKNRRIADLEAQIAAKNAETRAIDRKLAAEDRARDRTRPPAPAATTPPPVTPMNPAAKPAPGGPDRGTDPLPALRYQLQHGTLPGTEESQTKIATEFLARHEQGKAAAIDRIRGLSSPTARVSGRTKDVPSALGKLAEKPKYVNATNLQDGTGVRVIEDSVEKVKVAVAKIKDRFHVIEEDDYISRPKDGYRSHHLIIRDDDGLAKEIQVRTQRQHEFAEWAHDVYKPHTPEQATARDANRETIASYSHAMSEFHYRRDLGVDAGIPPDCPPVVRQFFGCLGA